MNTEIITTILIGVVAIISSIIAFAGMCKSGNNVTREAKSQLQSEHKDMQSEHKDMQNNLHQEHQSIEVNLAIIENNLKAKLLENRSLMENKVDSVKQIINIEIAKAEERKNNLTPEQVKINQAAERIQDMYKGWLEANAKIYFLEKEQTRLKQIIKNLEQENKNLRSRLYAPNVVMQENYDESSEDDEMEL